MVFSPFIFEAFTVLIKKVFPRFIKANPFGRSSEYLLGTSSASRYFIQFRHCSGRKQSATCGVLNRCGEKYILSVRSKGRGNLRSGMVSQPLGGSAVSRHDKEVEIPIPVAGKCNLFSVGRPNGVGFIRCLCCQLNGCPTLCGDFVNIAFITKDNLRSIR